MLAKKIDVYTSKVLSHPQAIKISSQSLKISTTFEAPGNVVCIVMRAENNPGAPTAFEVFEKGINVPTKVGVVPNPGMAHAGVPYIITYTGLVKGTEYHAYCAQGNELVTNRVSFTTATVLDDTSIVHNTGDSVTLRTSYSKDGVARCIILDHGDPSPTADDILNGETNGVSYVGSYPLKLSDGKCPTYSSI